MTVPRRISRGNIRYKVEDIIIISLCTVICGSENKKYEVYCVVSMFAKFKAVLNPEILLSVLFSAKNQLLLPW